MVRETVRGWGGEVEGLGGSRSPYGKGDSLERRWRDLGSGPGIFSHVGDGGIYRTL